MTPPVPSRDSASGRAYNDVRNLARRHDRDPAEYFTLYALEGVLGRLALSASASDFVLKGGVLMAAFAARRPTRDIDMAARGFANDIAEVERRIRTILAVKRDDGLSFDPASVRGEEIRDEADYTGVRVGAVAQLATAHVALHIDVNFGDPIWPAPTEAVLPLLLGGSLRLLGYPDHMVLAEKIVTAIERGEQNTRWRDFTDISAIASTRMVEGHFCRRRSPSSLVFARSRWSHWGLWSRRCQVSLNGSGRCGAGGSASRRGRRRASLTFLVNVWRSPSRRSQGEWGS